MGGWYDLESLEELHGEESVRELVLRLAVLARRDRLGHFVEVLRSDEDVDARTKQTVLELAGERTFLLAFEDYSRRCRHLH
ncbi:MAG TPA: hypothetical protein VHF23_09515 [Gaiellaceae bacterium]|nr:hypothetical protein [Gaiellaceae bacterium]